MSCPLLLSLLVYRNDAPIIVPPHQLFAGVLSAAVAGLFIALRILLVCAVWALGVPIATYCAYHFFMGYLRRFFAFVM